jgi:hypothetical protein
MFSKELRFSILKNIRPKEKSEDLDNKTVFNILV